MPHSPSSGSPGPEAGPLSNVTPTRAALRQRLLAARQAFAQGPAFAAAQQAVTLHLSGLLERLEPTTLGLYWPIQAEFSAGVLPWQPLWPHETLLALPQALRPVAGTQPARMVYRRFTGPQTLERDEYGLPTGDGGLCEPDVVLVPCVGFTEGGFRLGYGGGFFDRYRAAHPGITTVGVAWSGSRLATTEFTPEPHDHALDLLITEDGLIGA